MQVRRYALFCGLLFLCVGSSVSQPSFSRDQIIEDLTYLKSSLETYHPNLYIYSSEKDVEDFFPRLEKTIPDSVTNWEAFSLISRVSSVIKDGHTYFKPDATTLTSYYTEKKVFPIIPFFDGLNLYTRQNLSAENNIPDGVKLLSINGRPAQKVVNEMVDGLLRDGENTTYPYWILNQFFTPYYSFYFGYPDSFALVFQNDAGLMDSVHIAAQNRTFLSDRTKDRYPTRIIKQEGKGNGIRLKILPELSTALLSIETFNNQLLKQNFKQKFQSTVGRYFDTISDERLKHLVLDLRGNQGGHLANGRYLLSHLLSSPYEAVKAFAKVKHDSSGRYLKKVKGTFEGEMKPHKNPFNGSLYVLTDGGTFSCSGIVTNVIQKYKRGIIVGDETGGSAYTLVGSPNKNVVLPNTKIQVEIPTLRFVLQDLNVNPKSGVMPHYHIKPTVQDLISANDPAYIHVLNLIRSTSEGL